MWLHGYAGRIPPGSNILRAAPAKYACAFLYAGSGHNDATYFILYQADVINRGILALNEYIGQKSKEIKQSERMLRAGGDINHRQPNPQARPGWPMVQSDEGGRPPSTGEL
ncbi:MAG: hypothetical protein WBX20_02195, partial [Terrimicrobiaceae bacterium]